MGKTRGFTLIELLVTIAVLAVIAMMAVPSFGNLIARKKLETKAKEYALFFGEVRGKAIGLQKEITIKKCPIVSQNEECPLNTATTYYQSVKVGNLNLTSDYMDHGDVILKFGANGLTSSLNTRPIPNPNYIASNPTDLTTNPPTNPPTIDEIVPIKFTLCDSVLKQSKIILISKVGTVDSITSGTCT
ncbi:prepilin-type N-terminal cleavage/methylation domain-containing protein [Acinetobacter sp. C26M]|uniref:pilus assembly FimT family protein n=1 Tax=unclassified Acinetobacter TaxID=196816 RepID=UPI002036BDB7|nr:MULTISPECIES: prepilin-type N-terminal cleavage/methylation domain-containing protein [unclassified Acinetobacter]USA46853.1 prepilin-type N-terminal cleavage/methylation domain-containing protein [Acinetobacter sp. C26M]USA50337.1 prepilin-type N-terminal cleavage/methylation domain-containing protein [Acinetobacter sp. C26G]